MDYILDTNIVVTYLRKTAYSEQIDKKYAPLSVENTPIISVVSVGEIRSIATRNKWGKKKLGKLQELLDKFIVADINVEQIIEKYAEIDAFSQGKLESRSVNFTARNMGKNDLWIAATASVLNTKLLTTDKDFNHLNGGFIDLEFIEFHKP